MSRAGTIAASQLRKDVDWEHIFGTLGARWFHTGGIYAGLSDTTPDVVEEAMAAARRHDTIISYDLNYRPSLWKAIGGKARAQEVNQRLAPYVDVMIGNEEDFTASLGFEVADTGADLTTLESANFQAMIGEATAAYPNFSDRVGGGDSFASGLSYALLAGKDLGQAVEYGAAHGALAMTTPGDTSMATLAEVETLTRGAAPRVQR